MAKTTYTVRRAALSDVEQIHKIWISGLGTALNQGPTTGDYTDYFANNITAYPGTSPSDSPFGLWVAVNSDQKVVGWLSLLPLVNNAVLRDFYG